MPSSLIPGPPTEASPLVAPTTPSLPSNDDGDDHHGANDEKIRFRRKVAITFGSLILLSVVAASIPHGLHDIQYYHHDEEHEQDQEHPTTSSSSSTTTTTLSSSSFPSLVGHGKAEEEEDVSSSSPPPPFPDDFVFGSATSSYQVEGAAHEDGRGLSIWDTFCYEGGHVLNNETGDVACNHYYLYQHDIQLMKQLNLQAYRFSISWSRILPTGFLQDGINQAGVDFYNRLIDALLANNIEPWITLFHWDLPQPIETKIGGWLDDREDMEGGGGERVGIVDAFGDYARICFEAFGDRVQHWITVNEPWTVAVHGYNDGIKAPGRYSNGTYETYIVAHNQLLAHARAVEIYRQEFYSTQKGKIGISNSADFRYPYDPKSSLDKQASKRAMLFQFGWFLDPIVFGDYPKVMRQRLGHRLPTFTPQQKKLLKGSYDFLGINTYSSALTSQPKQESFDWGGYWADMFVTTHNDPSWKHNFMGWAIVPDATRELLLWISQRYGDPLLYITENGTAEDESDVQTAQHDEIRRSFFEGHLRACAQAMKSGGVRLAGYFAWSLMDNFEWEYGYERRFGICFVDFETQVRTPKSSALWYSETILARGGNINMDTGGI